MAYITKADVAELGKTIATTDEANVTQICSVASTLVDAYCQRVNPGRDSFVAQDNSEYVRVRVRSGRIKIFPKYYQINSVSSIVLEAAGTNFKATNIKIVNSLQMIQADVSGVANGEYYVTVEYNSGFTTVPVEIVKATILTLRALLDEYTMTQLVGLSGMTLFKQGEITFQRSPKGMSLQVPVMAQLQLAEYRRVR